jgi:hypothetical protein
VVADGHQDGFTAIEADFEASHVEVATLTLERKVRQNAGVGNEADGAVVVAELVVVRGLGPVAGRTKHRNLSFEECIRAGVGDGGMVQDGLLDSYFKTI